MQEYNFCLRIEIISSRNIILLKKGSPVYPGEMIEEYKLWRMQVFIIDYLESEYNAVKHKE